MASFMERLDAANAAIGADNVIEGDAVKDFLAMENSLFLDVQDPGSDTVEGTYNASLGTLVFKADSAMADFKDPKIADRPKADPILVTCAVGGQAALGAHLLLQYGFTNVKVAKGGCVALKAAGWA